MRESLRALRRARHAAFRVLRARHPLLVYQMGKVGSATVVAALEAAGLEPLHLHFLGRQAAAARRSYRDRGLPLPYHFHLERALGMRLRWTRERVRIVTLVRDPIARQISSAYQTRERDDYPTADAPGMRKRLEDELSAPDALDYCYRWFDDEIAEVFGVDVLAQPFDRHAGFSICRGERAEVLVLKLERLDALWPVLESFVGCEVAPARANVRSRQSGGETYVPVRDALRLPRARLAELYDHRWVRHFYREDEVAGFVERWSGD